MARIPQFLILGAVLALAPAALGLSDVVINEFNYDDSSTDEYEFIELYNTTADPIDIGDWVIQVGDYLPDQDPPGVYYQHFIEPGTVIAGYGYWTIAMDAVTYIPGAIVDVVDPELRLDNGQNYAALRDASGTLLDAAGWELNKGYEFIPSEIHDAIGLGIWGNHVNSDNPLTAQSRFLDGLDTDDNGRDFGIQLATPGFSNNQPDLMPYFEDANGLIALDPVPDWAPSYRPIIAFDPGDPDPNGPSGYPVNPYAIPESPDGGLAMIAWDESGGGNAVYLAQLAKENFTLETYIYVAEEFTPSGYEETKVGVRGSADAVHNFDYYSGATGVCWLLQRGTTWQTLFLLDENNGNDGIDPNTPICATILGTIDVGVDPLLTGWQRLLLEVRGDQAFGIFGGTYGSRDDGIPLAGAHESTGPGGVYVSYREALVDSDTWDYARPPSLDAFSLTEPEDEIVGDVDGDGDVDLSDLAALLASYNKCDGDPDYNPAADFDGSGCIDLSDLAALLANYGFGT